MMNAIHKTSHRDHIYARCGQGHAFAAEVYTAIEIGMGSDILVELRKEGVQSARCPTCGKICPIAEPLTLHNSALKQCALYIPDCLSHREIEIRAEWLRQLAVADKSDIPAYFADAETVVGRLALAKWSDAKTEKGEREILPTSPKKKAPPEELVNSRPGETIPPIHEAFADLLLSDSKPPSVPPEAELDEPDDWLEGLELAMPHPNPTDNHPALPNNEPSDRNTADAKETVNGVSDNEKKHHSY